MVKNNTISIKDLLPGLHKALEVTYLLREIKEELERSGTTLIALRDLAEIAEAVFELLNTALRYSEEIPYSYKKNPKFTRFDSDQRRFNRPAFDRYEKPSKFQDRYVESFKNFGLQPSTLSKRETSASRYLDDISRKNLENTLDFLHSLVGQITTYIRLEKDIPPLVGGLPRPTISKEVTLSRHYAAKRRAKRNRTKNRHSKKMT